MEKRATVLRHPEFQLTAADDQGAAVGVGAKVPVGTLAEMSARGVSTPKAKTIIEALCGHAFSTRRSPQQ